LGTVFISKGYSRFSRVIAENIMEGSDEFFRGRGVGVSSVAVVKGDLVPDKAYLF
jgi:hypothetical protein